MAARTEVKVAQISRFAVVTSTTPYSPQAADLTNGNIAINDGYTWLEITNAAGASRTVTVTIPGGVDQDLVAPTRPIVMPTNDVYKSGVFPVAVYGPQILFTASGSGVSFRAFTQRGNA